MLLCAAAGSLLQSLFLEIMLKVMERRLMMVVVVVVVVMVMVMVVVVVMMITNGV